MTGTARFRTLLALSSLIAAAAAVAILLDRDEARTGLSHSGEAAQGSGGRSWTNSIGMTFVVIPPGTFTMGSTSDEGGDHEKPPHAVTLSRSFSLSTTEVTQAQWMAVMGNNPSRFRGEDLPVEQVSWKDAMDFIRELNSKEGTTRYRLPTEAEWEYACRAGTAGDGSGELESVAWYRGNGASRTHPVGLKRANAWGLHDMLGNVYEWCEDWKGDYPSADVTDPRGPCSGPGRVMRGGSWYVHDNRVHSFFRDFLTPEDGRSDIGFRVAAVAPTP